MWAEGAHDASSEAASDTTATCPGRNPRPRSAPASLLKSRTARDACQPHILKEESTALPLVHPRQPDGIGRHPPSIPNGKGPGAGQEELFLRELYDSTRAMTHHSKSKERHAASLSLLGGFLELEGSLANLWSSASRKNGER